MSVLSFSVCTSTLAMGVSQSVYSIAAKCLRTLSGLFSPNLIDQSSCKILTTHAKTRPILHDDWSIRLGENRFPRALKHFVGMLLCIYISCNTLAMGANQRIYIMCSIIQW